MTKTRRAYIFLGFGILFYVVSGILDPAEYFPSSQGRGYTLGAMLFIFLTWPIICHALILGFIGFLIARGNRDKGIGFRAFAILYFASGLWDLFGTVSLL
jgi:hypothetical protein